MQDKEFDELFRAKLDDFEITPTAGVWEGISDALEPRKRKTSLAFIMSIAASIIVIMAVGVLFIPQKVKIGKNSVAVAVKPGKSIVSVKPGVDQIAIKSTGQTNVQGAVNSIAQTQPVRIKKHISVKHQEPVVEQLQPVKPTDDGNQLAAVTPKEDLINAAVVPGKETPIAIQLPVADNHDFIAKSALTATQLPVGDKQDIAAPVKKKHRIRSLGDLINVVVAKVDKRKDKIIEFTDSDDDDESNITGVNLGVIKVKK